jgi:tape measure domain-containing protein
MEQAQIGFTTMLGSGAKAKAFLSQLQKFAAATPFEFPELVQASQRLLAMGIHAKDVVPYMRAIGDAVAGLGGGPELIDQVTTAIGQMSAKGKIQSDELLQLTEAGIPALKILAASYGVSAGKMQDMITKGKVLSDDALPRLIKGLETGTKTTQGFGGMMAKQSQSMAGLWSTLKDNVNMALSNMVTPAIPAIKKGLAGLIAWTGANGPKLASWVSTDVVPKLNQLIAWFGANKTEIASWFLSATAGAARFGAGLLRVVADVIGGFNGLLTGVGWVLSHIYDQVIKFLDGFSGLPVVGKKFKDAADSVRKYKDETDKSLKSAQAQGRGIQGAARTTADALDKVAGKADKLRGAINRVPSRHTTSVSAPGADSAASKMNAATRAANGIPRLKTTTVRVVSSGVGAVQREISSITGHVVAIQVGLVRGVGVRGFARGTSSAPAGLALVGERGPELVQFRGGEKVIPNASTMRRLRGDAPDRSQGAELLQPIQLVVDGKVLREVLLKVKRDQGGIALGLA